MNRPDASSFARSRVALAAAALFAAPSAFALTWDSGDLSIRLDTRVTESLAMRTEDPSSQIVGIANGGKAYSVNSDDADLAWKKGSLFAATTRVTPALSIVKKDFGLFARGNWSFDPRVKSHDLFDEDDFGAGHQFDQSVRKHSEHETDSYVGNEITLLDLYAFGSFNLAGHSITIKAGQQTVSWGEAFLVLNGLNSIQAYDANKANTSALELDEVTRPLPQVFASVDLWKGMSLEGWYQLKWRKTVLPYAGTFFSTNDYVAPAGIGGNIDFGRAGEYVSAGSECHDPNQFPAEFAFECVPYGGSIPRGGDSKAKDSGQFGVALNGSISALNEMVYALYAANYHSRRPLFSSISAASGNIDASTARVIGEYPENIHMYGVSFNASGPWSTALQGEISYKPNQPLELDDVEQSLADLGAPSQIDPVPGETLGNQYIRGWRRHKVSVVDVSVSRLFAPNTVLRYDDLLALLEFGYVRVHDLPSQDELRYEGPGTFLPGNAQIAALQGVPVQHGGFATANSYGFNLILRATYNNVLPSLQVKPNLRWSQGLHGITPAPMIDFVEHTKVLNPGVQFVYGQNLSVDVGYNVFWGGGQQNLLRDRDFVSLDIKYSF